MLYCSRRHTPACCYAVLNNILLCLCLFFSLSLSPSKPYPSSRQHRSPDTYPVLRHIPADKFHTLWEAFGITPQVMARVIWGARCGWFGGSRWRERDGERAGGRERKACGTNSGCGRGRGCAVRQRWGGAWHIPADKFHTLCEAFGITPQVYPAREREFFMDNLLVRIHFIIEMTW